MPNSMNLVPGGEKRRTNKAIERYVDLEKVYEKIHTDTWGYKTRKSYYHTRDRALAALLFLTSGRVNEVLRLRKDQFKEYSEEYMLIDQFWVSKRKAGKRHPRIDVPLPLTGPLAPFTELVLDYLEYLDEEEKLFKFGRDRAWDIINTITGGGIGNREAGVWPHWFRSQSLSYLVNLIRSATAVARLRGIENPSTIAHYYRGEWEMFKDELSGKKR